MYNNYCRVVLKGPNSSLPCRLNHERDSFKEVNIHVYIYTVHLHVHISVFMGIERERRGELEREKAERGFLKLFHFLDMLILQSSPPPPP
jgi:hypothetical protein